MREELRTYMYVYSRNLKQLRVLNTLYQSRGVFLLQKRDEETDTSRESYHNPSEKLSEVVCRLARWPRLSSSH